MIKNRFLKKARSLPMWSGNEFVYQLCQTKRFCEDLKEKGYPFDEDQYHGYLLEVEASKQRELKRCRNTLAFEDDTWKGIQQSRHFWVGYSAHGFHFRLCTNQKFHMEADERCCCKLCNEPLDRVDHLSMCTALNGTLYERYKRVNSGLLCFCFVLLF